MVLNVGAGTGSYAPDDLDVVAVEPSFTMIRQRRQAAAPAVQARAEALPFPDSSFDAILGVLTLHHWSDVELGLAECARIARDRAVFLTIDVGASGAFRLLQDYFPDIHKIDQETMSSLGLLAAVLGPIDSALVNIPADCMDGLLGAYWRRPEAYLDPVVRASMWAFSRISGVAERIETLRHDLTSDRWAR